MTDKPIYYGIFLDEEHSKLLQWWKSNINYTFLNKIFAHHMTVKFKPSIEDVILYNTMLGRKITMKIVGFNANDKGQAVLVKPQGLTSSNIHPHITISCAENITPVYSNELLALQIIPVDGPLLTGILDAFPRTL